jgi:hypothetical protein
MDGFMDSNFSRKIISHDSEGNYDYDYLYPAKRDKIRMHDHIRHLARHIAREEYGVLPTLKPLRLSCSDDVEELMLKLQVSIFSPQILSYFYLIIYYTRAFNLTP